MIEFQFDAFYMKMPMIIGDQANGDQSMESIFWFGKFQRSSS